MLPAPVGRLYRQFLEPVAAVEAFLDRVRQLRQRQADVESQHWLADGLVGLNAPQVYGSLVPELDP